MRPVDAVGFVSAGIAGLMAGRVTGMMVRRELLVRRPSDEAGAFNRSLYPIALVLNLALYVCLFWRLGLSSAFLLAGLFTSVLVAVSLVDLVTHTIPNSFVAAGLAIAAAGLPARIIRTGEWIGGALCAGLVFLVISVVSRGGMGGGDVKLAFVIGGAVGWPGAVVFLMATFITGAVVALILMAAGLKGRRDYIPFGPVMAAGAVVTFLWGNAFIHWYVARFMV